MSKFFKLSDIEVYKEALLLVKEIYKLASNSKLHRDYFLIDQIKRSALSVAINISEGYGRKTNKDFSQFLSISLGSCNETISLLDFITLQYGINIEEIRSKYELLAKRIYTFRSYLLKNTHN